MAAFFEQYLQEDFCQRVANVKGGIPSWFSSIVTAVTFCLFVLLSTEGRRKALEKNR